MDMISNIVEKIFRRKNVSGWLGRYMIFYILDRLCCNYLVQ